MKIATQEDFWASFAGLQTHFTAPFLSTFKTKQNIVPIMNSFNRKEGRRDHACIFLFTYTESSSVQASILYLSCFNIRQGDVLSR